MIELANKPDFDQCMKRINAWYNQEMIDRPPIRFSAHNAEFSFKEINSVKTWKSLKERWFDAEFQVDSYLKSIEGIKFYAETFPILWPNLGPDVFAAFFGSELEYTEVTSFSIPLVNEWDEIYKIKLNKQNEYFRKIEEITLLALEKCPGKFMVGFTDIMSGMDCVAAWRGPQQLCMDLLMNPDEVKELLALASGGFHIIYDHFDAILKKHKQLSSTWMGIPSYGTMHIPSCDFSAMISTEQFEEFCLPLILDEIKPMTHNIFHLDGKGVARHVDTILQIKEINAIQWVQGMGDDTPIMQWVPFIKKIQAAGKSVIIDLELSELNDFINAMENPKGLMLCIACDQSIQPEIIKKIEKWK